MKLQLEWDAKVHVEEKPNSEHVLLLLHGLTGAGVRIFTELKKDLSPYGTLVAPDGLFCFPVGEGETARLGHAWYFYEHLTKRFLMDMKPSLRYLREIIKNLGYEKKRKRIIGYSQGGYLAPFLGQELDNVDQVISIHGRFRDDLLEKVPPFRMDAMNGAIDKMVDPLVSQDMFTKLKERGMTGEFRLLPETGHEINARVRETLREFISLVPF